ncbi:hypothetical protein CMO96_03805 [Candidatus Woesebacteria bacterium]|nr:hypothetical protein [Candidatus Woesebacteria bacterium]
MIPLFTSHYSIGKSILTLDHPSKVKPEGADSIFSIAQDHDLQEVVLVENALTGFLQAHNVAKDLGIKLIFGLKINVRPKETTNGDGGAHKIIVFAKNAQGCKTLNKIYSLAFTEQEGYIDSKSLQKFWDDSSLKLAIPFYDSFIFNNTMTFDNCVPDFRFANPTFFIESNSLPFDELIEARVKAFIEPHGYKTEKVKSIFYKSRADVAALQTYKCICGRQFQNKSLTKPNLDHFGSNEFCMEALQS